MINRLRRMRVGTPLGNADSIGFSVNTQDQIVANYGPTLGEKVLQQVPVASPALVLTASTTLTAADSGKVVVFNDNAASIVATLPRASACKGCKFRFAWRQLPGAGVGHSVSPNALDGVGGGVTALTSVVDKDILSVAATDALTDRIEIVSTGATGTGAWIVTEAVGVISKEA